MFGVSGSSSRSRSSGESQSTSKSFGSSEQGAISGSVGGGFSTSRDQSTSGSSESVAFEDVFARLFQGAEGAAAGLDPSMLTEASNQLFSGGMDFLQGLGGDEGTAFLTERLANRDALEGEQIGQLQSDIGDLFREELMPGITSEAVGGGQLGGGRQGVAQAGALDAASEAFTKGSLDIRSQNQAQLDELAAGIAQRDIQGAEVGLAGSPGLQEIASGGFTSGLVGMEFLANILGGPTVLGESSSQSSGLASAEDFARAFSESFGSSVSGSDSQSTSKTESKSKSSSVGIGF